MKKFLLKTLMVFVLLATSSVGVIMAESRELILFKTQVIHVDEEPSEHRVPSRPIQCSISEDGIFIQGYGVGDIISYEAYDLNGVCLMATDNALEFASLILSVETDGQIEVRLTTEDYILKGYVY